MEHCLKHRGLVQKLHPRPASFRRQPSASSDTCLVNGELSTMAFNMIENSWKVRTICQQLDTIVAYILQNSIAL